MGAMENEWVEVRSTTWLHEAELVRSVLDSVGIQAEIPNEHTLGVQPLYAQALGGVRVLVRRADFERAMQVLTTDAPPSD